MIEFIPKDFNYKNLLQIKSKLKIKKSTDPKTIGEGGRDYQLNCYKRFENKTNTIFISPTGSGKSLVQIFNAAREIINSGYKQKQVFVVPQLNIGKGFSHHKHERLFINDQNLEWRIEEDCCDDNKKSTNRIKKFLLNDINCEYEIKNKIIGGCTAIVSYSALLKAFDSMNHEEKIKALSNVSFRLDEVHHIAEMDCDINSNRLGEFCRFVLTNKGSLHLTTATFFRGDGQRILGDKFINEFEIYRVPFLEHFDNLGIQSLTQNYCAYKNPDDLLKNIVKSCKSEPNEYPIIILPSDKQSFFSDCDKWKWTKDLVKKLSEIYGKGSVLDLVSEDTQKVDKERLLSENQDFKAIVTCAIGREGTDWTLCSRVYNCILDRNVLQPIQKLGRALRYHDGKNTVKMINFINHFGKWDKNSAEVREKISDRFNAVLFGSMLDDMFYPKLVDLSTKDKSKKNKRNKVSLEDIFGHKRNDVIQELLIEVSSLKEKTSMGIDQIVDDILEAYKDEIQEDVDLLSLKNRLRYEVLIRFNDNIDLKLGVDVDFIRKDGWDKIVKNFIDGHSIFTGITDSKELKKLDEILQEWKKSSAQENKKQLLEMARKGENRPNKKHELGTVLCHYTNPKSGSYDEKFDKEIRELRPDWFITQSDKAQENKNQLLEMAEKGENRPNKYKHKLGKVLCNYTNSKRGCYDEKFDNQIRELRPDWFINPQENKNQLLEMSRNGEDRPSKHKHKLGKVLCNYTNVKSSSYDEKFYKEIRKLAPHWFKHKER